MEDATALLQLNQRMLTSLGYTVLAAAASTPGEAIRLARESQGRIDLLLTDVVMPEMNGRELAAKLHSFMADHEAGVHVGLHRQRHRPSRCA